MNILFDCSMCFDNPSRCDDDCPISKWFSPLQPDKDTVGGAIRLARRELFMTQRELAERVGVDFATISRIENNRIEPDQTILSKIWNALGGAK